MIQIAIVGVGVVTALFLIFSANTSTAGRLQMRAQLAGRYERTKVQAKAKLHDDRLEKLLADSGLRMGPSTYNYIRVLLTFLLLLIGGQQVLSYHKWIFLALPIVSWFGLDYRIFWMDKLFKLLKQRRRARLNRDVFLLYKLVTLELEAYQAQKRTVYDMLVRVAPLMPHIRPALTQCLLLWQRSPKQALQAFATEIGTEEAHDLAQVLLTVEESTAKTGFDLLKGKYASFKRERISWFRQKLYVYGLISLGIATTGVGAVGLDILRVIAIYSTHLMQQF